MPDDLSKKISENDDEEIIKNVNDNNPEQQKTNSNTNTNEVDNPKQTGKANPLAIP